MSQETNLYELSYLLKATSSEEAELIINKIRKHLEDRGVIVMDVSRPEKRRLGYPIKKEVEAHFGYIKFLIKEKSAEDLKEFLLEQKNVLRYILVKTAAREKSRRKEIKIEKKRTLEPAADVESIDKKLEEILGK